MAPWAAKHAREWDSRSVAWWLERSGVRTQIAQELFEMVTIRAARALGMDHGVGSLTVGKRADLVAFEVSGDEPLDTILTESPLPAALWIDG